VKTLFATETFVSGKIGGGADGGDSAFSEKSARGDKICHLKYADAAGLQSVADSFEFPSTSLPTVASVV
jgi:hypothetical protein